MGNPPDLVFSHRSNRNEHDFSRVPREYLSRLRTTTEIQVKGRIWYLQWTAGHCFEQNESIDCELQAIHTRPISLIVEFDCSGLRPSSIRLLYHHVFSQKRARYFGT